MLNARKSIRMKNELQVMELNIAICDDEKIIREQIKELAEKEIPGVCAGLYETGMLCLPPGNGVYKDEEQEFFTGKGQHPLYYRN